jgi:aminoglycoside phosphotransferase (APT) family kinase protein
VAHTDWSARNVRLDDAQLVAVYDWDSLALVPETTALGYAAMTWTVTSEPGGTVFPTLADVTGYVVDYEDARGRALPPAEWQAAGAAAAWALAYTARCEHALDVRGLARPDQCGARDRLADAGAALLGLRPP